MTDPVERGARAAAQRMAVDHGPRLAMDVDAALRTRSSTQRPEKYFDPISLGALIVSVASLAWTVYSDLKKRTLTPSVEVVTRAVQVHLQDAGELDPAEHDRIIDIVVTETLRVASEPN